MHSITIDLPICPLSEIKENYYSPYCRISLIAIGAIVATIGILALYKISVFSSLGSIASWTCVGTGSFLMFLGSCIRCVKQEKLASEKTVKPQSSTSVPFAEWKQVLSETRLRTCWPYFNLENPTVSIAENLAAFTTQTQATQHKTRYEPYCIPDSGIYGGVDGKGGYPTVYKVLGIRFPKSHLTFFPQPIQHAFKNLEAVELYFLVFDDSRLEGNAKRNLIFHFAMMPEARYGLWHQKTLPIGIFQPVGVEEVKNAQGISFNQFKNQHMILHPSYPGGPTCISPDTAQFNRQGGYSSFYAACFDHKRGIACLTLMISDKELLQSINKSLESEVPLQEFISNFPEKTLQSQVSSLFRLDEEKELEKWAKTLETVEFQPRSSMINLENPTANLTTSSPAFDNLNDFLGIGFYAQTYFQDFFELNARLPPSHLIAFPPDIQKAFSQLNKVNLFFTVYNDVYVQSKAPTLRRNIIWHHCVFPEAEKGKSYQKNLPMGIFEPIGIDRSTHEGIAFGSFKEELVYLHPSGELMAISPNNASFMLKEDSSYASFFTAVYDPIKKEGSAAFAVILKEGEMIDSFKKAIKQSKTLPILFKHLQETTLNADLQQRIQRFFYRG